MDNPVIIKWVINTGFAMVKHSGQWKIDREEWNELNNEERDKMLDEMLQDEIANHIDASYEVQNETNRNP